MIFITFEGPEGSGKTSILEKLKERLWKEGLAVIATREPGGSVISEQIRQIILNKTHKTMDPWTEVLLYVAARRQHLEEKIFPEKNSKKIIICDRFSDSTVAYQGYGRKLDINKINKIQEIAFDNFEPNLTIFFDVDPKIGLKRIWKRKFLLNHKHDRLDKEDLEFHERVYQGYKTIAKHNKDRIKIVNANQKFNEVFEEVYKLIKIFIEKNNYQTLVKNLRV
ncbi:MAG: dTMP kinase [Spiroplasma sp.]|nr:dTMP kinase [Spiroplasma sp.]